MFTDAEVLKDVPPSNRIKITSPRMVELTPWECSCSRTQRAHDRGSFLGVYSEGWPKATATTQMASQQAAPVQEVEPQQEGTISQQPTPPPVFVEITQSLCRDNLLMVVAGIPLELAKDQGPIQMVVYTMLSVWLFQDATSGAMCIDMVMCSMNLVGMGIVPPVDDHPIPTLLEEADSD